jgi:3-oxoadipate enol-lactonase
MTSDTERHSTNPTFASTAMRSSSELDAALSPVRHIDTAVGSLAVRDSASGESGETIVLWPSILADHQIYQVPIASWLGKHRLVVIDGPGHGDSGPAPALFTMKQCGQAMADILNQLDMSTPVIIVGCSWGGLGAGEFAIENSSRTKAVVMLNTPVQNKKNGLKLRDRFVVWGAYWLHSSRVYQNGVARSFFLPKTRQRGGPLMEAFRQHLQNANGAALARSVRSVILDREPLAPRMIRISAPTLFIAGRFDGMYPPETLRDAFLSIPNGRFEILDTSHISVVDEPEKTVLLINEFIATL